MKKHDESLHELISFAGHEIKNPMTTMGGYIHLLKRKLNGTDTQEAKWVDELVISNAKVMRLVDQLLLINRILRGKIEYEWEESPINQLLEKADRKFHAAYPDFTITLKNDSHSTVVMDVDRLAGSVADFYGYLAKLAEENEKEIRVTVTETKTDCVVEIYHQNELGKNKLERLISECNGGKEEFADGMNLGVFLACLLLKVHQGKLELGKLKKGTSVLITLPKATSEHIEG